MDMHRVMENSSHSTPMFSPAGQQWNALPSRVSSHDVNKYPFVVYFLPCSSYFCAVCWRFCHLKWPPSTMSSCTPEYTKAMVCLNEKMFVLYMFHTVHGILKARILKWFPFLSPGEHVLSECSTMTRPSWAALHSMSHSFIELDKAVVHVIRLISFLRLLFSFYPPSDG